MAISYKHLIGILPCALGLLISCSPQIGPEPEEPGADTSDEFSITLAAETASGLTVSEKEGMYTICTTGAAPEISTSGLPGGIGQNFILTFEYTADRNSALSITMCGQGNSLKHDIPGLPATGEGNWSRWSCDLGAFSNECQWGKDKGDYLIFTFSAGCTINMRDIRFAGSVSGSVNIPSYSATTDYTGLGSRLSTYLETSFQSEITSVKAVSSQLYVKGVYNGKGKASIVEVTPYEDAVMMKAYKKCMMDINPGEEFFIPLSRTVEYDGFRYDRILSKFAISEKQENGEDKLVSAFRYVDNDAMIYTEGSSADASWKNKWTDKYLIKKGGELGKLPDASGAEIILDTDCIKDLGLRSVMLGFQVTSLMYYDKGNSSSAPIEHQYNGKTYYFDRFWFSTYDSYLKELEKQGIAVFAVFTIRPETRFEGAKNADPQIGRLMQHPGYPDNAGNDHQRWAHYAMVNLTEPESVNYFAAALDFIASRYSTPGSNGLIHRYVLLNEVDDPDNWNCCGWAEKPAIMYMDMLVKAYRMANNIIRQYNRDAQVLIPVTNAWTTDTWKTDATYSKVYKVKDLLEATVRLSRKEGDFHWGIGYHSYPEDMVSDTWNDADATYSLNTKRLTFKNLEVLDHWAGITDNMYNGQTVRDIWLTENGGTSGSNTEQEQLLQAACAAFALKKVEHLPNIDALIWHALKDNEVEGGLNLGLLDINNVKKPSYYVYSAAYTENEDAVFSKYKVLETIRNTAGSSSPEYKNMQSMDDIIQQIN